MESNGSKVTVALVTMAIGLVVGGGIGYAVADMNKEQAATTSQSSMSKQDGVTVGGAVMVRDKDVVDNAANASNVSTLVSLVKKADLVETLKGDGPFTVFGPTNDAFAKLPEATVADLQKEENKAMLANILTYHVVPGTYTSADLKVMAQKGEGLKTVQGQELLFVMEDNKLMVRDDMSNNVEIETSDIISSNGVTHTVKSVLMPKS